MPQISYFNSFAGGINQALPPRDIADNELVEAMNFELNRRRGLRKRGGTTLVKSGAQPFSSKDVSSIYFYKTSAGASTVIYTAEDEAFRRAPTAPGTSDAYTAIDGSVTLATGARWEWVTFDDEAIGVNGLDPASYSNAVELTTTTGNLAVETWTNKPAGWIPAHVETWNRRLWIASGEYLYGSALGDHTDWDTSGSTAVAFKVGQDVKAGEITAIKSFLGRLFVFFEHEIHQIIPGGETAVDETGYQPTVLTRQLGCVDSNTIQYVGNDLVFLSHEGLTSLRGTDEFGDVQHAILSKSVPELSEADKSDPKFQSVVHAQRQQYWLAMSTEGGDNDVVWVMDFRDMADGSTPWMKWDGGVVGSAYESVIYEGKPYIHIGSTGGEAYVYDEDVVGDADLVSGRFPQLEGANFTPAYAKTKAFDQNAPLVRKEYFRAGVQFESLSSSLDIDFGWTINEDVTRSKTLQASYANSISTSLLGTPGADNVLWDDPPTVGSFVLASDVRGSVDFLTAIRGTPGRRGHTIQFIITIPEEDESAELRALRLDWDYIRSNREVSD